MKKLKITFSYVLGGVVLLGVVALAGSLSPSAPVGATMKTMEDVYQKLTLNTYTPSGVHDLSTTSSPTEFGTMHSLSAIWDAIPTLLANTIATGTTYMGITGTLYGDTDPSKVLNTATYPGTATAGAPALEWSADLGGMTWDAAMAYCTNPANGYTRLPNIAELTIALSNSFLTGGSTLPGGFAEYTYYWSSTEYGSDLAWYGYFGIGYISISYDTKDYEYSVRCVR